MKRDRLVTQALPLFPSINRRIRSGRILAARLFRRASFQAISAFYRILRVRPKHVVISGFPRSGTTLLYNMIRHSIESSSVFMPPQELSALSTLAVRRRVLVTKRPLDILKLSQINDRLGKNRQLVHIVMVRDPRDLISSQHESVPNQFFQGVDYQFFVRPDFRSFTGPGVAEIARQILTHISDGNVIVLRYEDLVADPDWVQGQIRDKVDLPLSDSFRDFHDSPIPEDLRIQLNGVRETQRPEKPAWLTGDRHRRVCEQLALFPELDELAEDLGYARTKQMECQYGMEQTSLKVDRGVIVAFHTDDEFYRKEALRCKRQLDRLMLEHEFECFQEKSSWVDSCALKPDFLLSARKRLRGPLLYIDVDAFVHKDPWQYLSQYTSDIAVHYHCDGSLLSGTILINDTPGALEILERWVDAQRRSKGIYDQKVLQDVISAAKVREEFNVGYLPPTFVYISDRSDQIIYGTPFIEHFQASRYKRTGARGSKMAKRLDELSNSSR